MGRDCSAGTGSGGDGERLGLCWRCAHAQMWEGWSLPMAGAALKRARTWQKLDVTARRMVWFAYDTELVRAGCERMMQRASWVAENRPYQGGSRAGYVVCPYTDTGIIVGRLLQRRLRVGSLLVIESNRNRSTDILCPTGSYPGSTCTGDYSYSST